ncbi:hypothetical protein HBA43_09885 [Providencia rettgeri]|uniref:Uncharacterized protein n=1 Tax=Providencia huashanensis TaxID=3037798 RepID=A0AA42FH66_9GAMM|nr:MULTISPECIES: hypothetical protein [Providencia]EJD6374579.1 hypothetical protein [Providencia rettgeri]EJD6408192.1 hypothetical protein [Providencia rettgeri]EJD6661174.1 hypothetical protein [Providencia rettgeri]ELR5030429.1 hypothetical protein [Providencia rettgeri]ELR5078882.1 hypothetical protein [Providencia rettgeri]
MITFEVILWIAGILVISAVAFLVWVTMIILSNKAKADAQRENTKNKVENGD